jgi:hypothetical protein
MTKEIKRAVVFITAEGWWLTEKEINEIRAEIEEKTAKFVERRYKIKANVTADITYRKIVK